MGNHWMLASVVAVAASASMFAGCAATEPSACELAAVELTGCTADQTSAFVAACEDAGGAIDPAQLAAEEGAAACQAPALDGKSDLATSALVATCVSAMYGVKWTITALSPEAQALGAATKAALRPRFGALVDTVRISFNASLPPRIVVGGHKLAVEAAAMTFGSTIFIRPEHEHANQGDNALLLLAVHEMTHAQQAARAGGFYGFAVNYCRDMVAANFDYGSIGMEQAAYGVEDEAEHALHTCGKLSCP